LIQERTISESNNERNKITVEQLRLTYSATTTNANEKYGENLKKARMSRCTWTLLSSINISLALSHNALTYKQSQKQILFFF
jgi:cytosine/uracil/thiamine/allantoin permease